MKRLVKSYFPRSLLMQIEQGVVFQAYELKIDTLQSLKLNETLIDALIAEIATEEVITAVVFRSDPTYSLLVYLRMHILLPT